MIHQGETRPVSPPTQPARRQNQEGHAGEQHPSAILSGVDGSSPLVEPVPESHQRDRKTTIQNGLIALEITPETSVPSIRFKVKIWIKIGVTLEPSSRCSRRPSRSSCCRSGGTPSRTRSRSRR